MSDNKLQQTVADKLTHRDQFGVSDFDVSAGSPGSRTKVAEFQANRPLALRNNFPVDIALMAYEEFTADGASPETFDLSHDLVESGATSQNVVVYVNDTEVQPESVDYDADTIDVETEADETVGVFYASGKQARVEVQKQAPNGTSETLWSGDVKLLHLRDHNKDPVTFSLDASFWESIIPIDWKLQVYVNAPYVARFEKDVGGDGEEERATNALLGLPFIGGRSRIDGLGKRVRVDSAER